MKKITLLFIGFLFVACTNVEPKVKIKSCLNLKFTAYDECQRTHDFYILTKDNKKALFDLNGSQIIDFLYDSIYFKK
jgi:ribosomal protein L31